MITLIKRLQNSRSLFCGENFGNLLIEVNDDMRIKLQHLLLDMYKDIYYLCKKYNIISYLIGESALGAIRHKGFMEWLLGESITLEKYLSNLFGDYMSLPPESKRERRFIQRGKILR